jgi:hypothetical protein
LLTDFFSKIQINSLDEMLVVGSKKLYRENVIILTAYFALNAIGSSQQTKAMDELLLHKPLQNVLKRTGRGEKDISLDITLIKLLLKHQTGLFFPEPVNGKKVSGILEKQVSGFLQMLDDARVKEFIGVNEYQDVWYYSKENFEELVDWLFSLGLFSFMTESIADNSEESLIKRSLTQAVNTSVRLKEISEKSGYQFEKLKQHILDWS